MIDGCGSGTHVTKRAIHMRMAPLPPVCTTDTSMVRSGRSGGRIVAASIYLTSGDDSRSNGLSLMERENK